MKKSTKKPPAKKRMARKHATRVSVQEYAEFLADIKQYIAQAQVKTVLAANKELLKMYWHIGKTIVENQELKGWGAGALELLARDLQKAFPGMEGFSRTNMFRMKLFYNTYAIVPQAVGQLEDLPIFSIPWGHNVVLLEKLKAKKERLWYAQKTIENGWSRAVLTMQIESSLYRRQGKAITNFSMTLPAPQSDLAHQALKDPYVFDFLTLRDDFIERELEQGLLDHVQKFLLELGQGFAFVGRQKHLVVGSSDFYIDLLLYNINLHCYVVVELKTTDFKPEYAGQLNFYLSAVDDLIRKPDDKPTIGLLLCKTKDNIVAEYALRDINKPIGVAGFATQIVKNLPKGLKSSLPSIKEIEAGLETAEIVQKTVRKKHKKTPSRK
jgi:predicted nuclease of restriction endonuclease-like (RecB) superfamily